MASKLAKYLDPILIAWTETPEDGRTLEQVLADAFEGKTISAKEVARLQEGERILSSAIDVNNDLLRTNSELKEKAEFYFKLWGLAVDCKDVVFRQLLAENKNSQQLQEKLTISIENEAQLRKEIERLQKTGTALASYILVQIADESKTVEEKIQTLMDAAGWKNYYDIIKKPEQNNQITPPPCLKPLDAMKWNEQVVSGSITYRG